MIYTMTNAQWQVLAVDIMKKYLEHMFIKPSSS
jgi:hypothetical protein